MKSVIVKQSNSSKQLVIVDREIPKINEEELLIKVHYTSVNRTDLLKKQNTNEDTNQTVLGVEIAGEVVQVGKRCHRFTIGSRVMGLVNDGGYAQYCIMREDRAINLPNDMTYAQASAIPEVFLTAYQTLFWLGKLKENETVLIHAGASGVGTAAIQLAKHYAKANVIVTAGTDEKLAFCKQLGADEVIHYKKQSFDQEVLQITNGKGVDLILDFVGASYWDKNLTSMKVDGRWVLIGILGGIKVENMNLMSIISKRIQITGTLLTPRSDAYKAALTDEFKHEIMPYFQNKIIKPIIDTEFLFEEINQAHFHMEQNRNIGKIVIKVS